MSIQDFQILAKLGQGAYSSVYKVRRLVDDQIYALKKVKLINLSARQIHNAVNQVRILASIRHPNIICYKQAFYDSSSKSLCIVMQYADGGDLLQKIFKHKKTQTYFEQDYIWSVFRQILKALQTLHDLKILHRDIKNANVFLMKNGNVKLGDLNVSKVLRKEIMCETQTGTPYYASPQVWRDEAYDAKSDIWSLGCVLYELVALRPPFRARDMEGLYRKVTKGYYSRINKRYSQDLSLMIRNLIKVNPEQRLNCQQLLGHPLMKKKSRKLKQIEVEEQSILLKTIKITKNINYLTQKLPRPNYMPLRFKSGNKSLLTDRNKNPYDLQISLPPINSLKNIIHNSVIQSKLKKSHVAPNSRASLPKISIRKSQNQRQYLS